MTGEKSGGNSQYGSNWKRFGSICSRILWEKYESHPRIRKEWNVHCPWIVSGSYGRSKKEKKTLTKGISLLKEGIISGFV